MKWIGWPMFAVIWLAELMTKLLKRILPDWLHPIADYLVVPLYLAAVMMPIVIVAVLGEALFAVSVIGPSIAVKWLLSEIGLDRIAPGAALVIFAVLAIAFVLPGLRRRTLDGRPPEMADGGE